MCWKYLQIFANFQKLLETKVSKSFHSYLTRNVCLFALLEGLCLFSVIRYSIRMELFFYQEHSLFIFFQPRKRVFKKLYILLNPIQFYQTLICVVYGYMLCFRPVPFCDVEHYPEQGISIRWSGQTSGRLRLCGDLLTTKLCNWSIKQQSE